MPTRTQLDAIITKLQGSRDLSPGGIAALKEALHSLNESLVEEAPEDGNQYGREDGEWTLLTSGLPPDGDYGQVIISSGIWVLDAALSDLQPATAVVDFNQQQANSLTIENRLSDPGSPVDGQIWLRVDL